MKIFVWLVKAGINLYFLPPNKIGGTFPSSLAILLMRTTLNCVNHSNKIQNSGEAHKQPLIHFQTTLDGHFLLKPGSCSHAKKKNYFYHKNLCFFQMKPKRLSCKHIQLNLTNILQLVAKQNLYHIHNLKQYCCKYSRNVCLFPVSLWYVMKQNYFHFTDMCESMQNNQGHWRV